MSNSVDEQVLLKKVRHSKFFDGDWYVAKYAEVEASGLTPECHYLRYGAELLFDPGPYFSTRYYFAMHPHLRRKNINPLIHHARQTKRGYRQENTLKAANEIALSGQHSRAIKLAARDLPEKYAHSMNILKANRALSQGSQSQWLHYLNKYLQAVNTSSIALNGEGGLVHQLSPKQSKQVSGGPLVTVLMAVYNASKTLEMAVNSVLNQSWQALELLIVDDASEDDSWIILNRLARTDRRIKISRNAHNVGCYVSKNLASKEAQGAYITSFDADDWAHPDWLHSAMQYMSADKQSLPVTSSLKIKMTLSGRIINLCKMGSNFSQDGVSHRTCAATIFDRKFFQQVLGGWDSVRFAADTELIARCETLLSSQLRVLNFISSLVFMRPESLTSHPEYGVIDGKRSAIRIEYHENYVHWQQSLETEAAFFMPFPHSNRNFKAPAAMLPDVAAVKHVVEAGFKS